MPSASAAARRSGAGSVRTGRPARHSKYSRAGRASRPTPCRRGRPRATRRSARTIASTRSSTNHRASSGPSPGAGEEEAPGAHHLQRPDHPGDRSGAVDVAGADHGRAAAAARASRRRPWCRRRAARRAAAGASRKSARELVAPAGDRRRGTTVRRGPAASSTFRVPRTLMRMKSSMRPRSATSAAAWTMASAPARAATVEAGSATSARRSGVPARSMAMTVWPSARRRLVSAAPMKPDAPVTAMV